MPIFNRIAKIGFIICIIIIIFLLYVPPPAQTRDFDYEAYCDSIWYNDPDYYCDYLVNTDKYQRYIGIHGEWWEQDAPYNLLYALFTEVQEDNDFKSELIDAQQQAIDAANKAFKTHHMSDNEFDKSISKCDSLIAIGQQ